MDGSLPFVYRMKKSILSFLRLLPTFLLVSLIHPVSAAIPYTPSYVFSAPQYNGSLAYMLRSDSGQKTEFLSLNTSGEVSKTNPQYNVLLDETPFQSDGRETAFVPVMDQHGVIKVYAGSCQDNSGLGVVWEFVPDNSSSIGNGTWEKMPVGKSDESRNAGSNGPKFLSAVFTHAPTNTSNSAVYTFGGMCPFRNDSDQSWISAANYSQSMTVLDPLHYFLSTNTGYQLSTTGHRAPPIPEAGFSITPLQATYAATSTGNILQQQDFLLIGGQTQKAFINMSELALFSLPQDSWSFVTVESELNIGKSELAIRDTTTIEPRSGHTAVFTPDGSKVVVFGGWVGDPTVPASPQLVVLELGVEYGGTGPWTWTVPSSAGSALPDGTGIYGHGATMLPGGVMMVSGGYTISQSSKRSTTGAQNSQVYFFNTTSNSWDISYTNPGKQTVKASSDSDSSNSKSRKTGLGIGLGFGVPAVACIAFCGWLYWRKRKVRRKRDSELRKLALGAQRSHFWGREEHGMASSLRGPSMRESGSSNSWMDTQRSSWHDAVEGSAEQTGLLLDAPSPTKSNRQSRLSHYGELRRNDIPGDIHPIDEREEYEAMGTESLASQSQRNDLRDSAQADFLTPQSTNVDSGAGAARVPLEDIGYLPSFASRGNDEPPSPSKDDRTSSNLSDSSANAASARSGVVPQYRPTIIAVPSSPSSSGRQSPEKPGSTSAHSNQTARTRPDSAMTAFENQNRYSSDSYSTAPSTFSHRQAEGELLLGEGTGPTVPPEESPKRITVTKPRTSEWMGNVRRVLSGTRKWAMPDKDPGVAPVASGVDRTSTVLGSSRTSQASGTAIGTPRRAVSASAELFRRKQGAKDWGAGNRPSSGETVFRTARSTRDDFAFDGLTDLEEDYDWDVEGAAEGRRVQVTFTVPKERLRVVNATAGDMDNISERSTSRNGSGIFRQRTVSR